MRKFQLQVKAIGSPIWYTDTSTFSQSPAKTEASTVSELREAIVQAADRRTLSFSQHVRIITDDGDPVERWVIRPGEAKKLSRRY